MIASGMPQFASRLAMMMPIESPTWRAATRRRAPSTRCGRAGAGLWHRKPRLDLWQVVQMLRQPCPPTRSSPTAPATSRPGPTASGATAACARSWRPPPAAWVMACRPASPPRLVAPERTVVTFAGDGDFLMTAQELATPRCTRPACSFSSSTTACTGPSACTRSGTIRRGCIGTQLLNPRFDLLAQSYGGFGAVVDSSAQFGPTLEEALAFTRARRLPAVIELRTDAQVITPGATLAAIRAKALSNR
jgi:acetolactate synthase I/II/III large subunit